MCKSCIPAVAARMHKQSIAAKRISGPGLRYLVQKYVGRLSCTKRVPCGARARHNHPGPGKQTMSFERKKFPLLHCGTNPLSSPLRRAKRKEAIDSHKVRKRKEERKSKEVRLAAGGEETKG